MANGNRISNLPAMLHFMYAHVTYIHAGSNSVTSIVVGVVVLVIFFIVLAAVGGFVLWYVKCRRRTPGYSHQDRDQDRHQDRHQDSDQDRHQDRHQDSDQDRHQDRHQGTFIVLLH